MRLALSSKSGQSDRYVLVCTGGESQTGLQLHDPHRRGKTAYRGEGQFESGV